MVPANSDRILRVPPYSGFHCFTTRLPVRDCHPLWCIFPDTSCSPPLHSVVLQPRPCRNKTGLGSSHFARHYFGNRSFFLFLQVLRCFSSLGSPSFECQLFKLAGFPIRTSADQFVFANPRGFSQLTTSFVAYRSQGILRSLFLSSS